MKDARVRWRSVSPTPIGIADIIIVAWIELNTTILAMHFHSSSPLITLIISLTPKATTTSSPKDITIINKLKLISSVPRVILLIYP